MSLSGAWYIGLAAVVFTIGAIGLLVRRNVLIMFMCIELMLNAANLTFVTFARMLNDIGGQVLVFFVLVVAAAEVVVGLGIVVTNYRRRATTVADDLDSLQGLIAHGPRRLPHAAVPPGRVRRPRHLRAPDGRPPGGLGRHGRRDRGLRLGLRGPGRPHRPARRRSAWSPTTTSRGSVPAASACPWERWSTRSP